MTTHPSVSSHRHNNAPKESVEETHVIVDHNVSLQGVSHKHVYVGNVGRQCIVRSSFDASSARSWLGAYRTGTQPIGLAAVNAPTLNNHGEMETSSHHPGQWLGAKPAGPSRTTQKRCQGESGHRA